MSILIRGMKMPKNCDECFFVGYGYPDWCSLPFIPGDADALIDISVRPDWCPLVELPEKHGRLIDGDMFKETIDYYIQESGWGSLTNQALEWVRDEFIDAEPTVIEAEEEE